MVENTQTPFDVELLDPADPFEIDAGNLPHLAKHGGTDPELLYSMWASERVYLPPAHGPADWLFLAEVGGVVYVAPVMKAEYSGPRCCRPIGIYEAGQTLCEKYYEALSATNGW